MPGRGLDRRRLAVAKADETGPESPTFAGAGQLWVEFLAWGMALLAAAAVLPLLDYQTRDADSLLYAEIAAQLSSEPLARWIAPEWPPLWYVEGPYR